MAKRKQRSLLKTKDASGRPLAKRKRWFSHGVERQAAKAVALSQEAENTLRRGLEEDRFDQWWEWDLNEYDWHDEHYFEDGYLEAVYSFLEGITTRRAILDAAPTALRKQWLDQQSDRRVRVNRHGLESRIITPWPNPPSKTDKYPETIGPITNIARINEVCRAEGQAVSATSIVYYAPFWLRQPGSFQGSTLRELIDYLFVEYPVPETLYSAWTGDDRQHAISDKWRQWFLCFAQGGSLYKLGKMAYGWQVSKRFQHEFVRISSGDSIQGTVARTELRLLGVSEAAAEYLLSSPLYSLDVTALWTRHDHQFLAHWRDTARWLDRHLDELDQGTVDYLLRWSHQQSRSYLRRFSWAKRKVRSSLQHADRYFKDHFIPLHRWDRHNLDWVGTDEWKIVELVNSTELEREGKQLKHYLQRYGYGYPKKDTAICSLRFRDKPIVTIELLLKTRELVQARGSQNRGCTAEEMLHIQQWLDEMKT